MDGNALTDGNFQVDMNQVVVTGMGVLTSVGTGVENYWDGLLSGKSGITAVNRFDSSDIASKVASEINDFNLVKGLVLLEKNILRFQVSVHNFILMAVIDARGVSSAAVNLNMTQPAITKRLKNLKMSFEIDTLYTRKNGEFIISEEAKLLIPFAQNVVALSENAKKEIQNYTSGVKGKIFIGAGTTWSLGNLPIALAKTSEANIIID